MKKSIEVNWDTPYLIQDNQTFFQDISRTFNTERTTIFIFSFYIGLVIQLIGLALWVLNHHFITKRIREALIGNSRFLIHNSLNQLLFYTDVKMWNWYVICNMWKYISLESLFNTLYIPLGQKMALQKMHSFFLSRSPTHNKFTLIRKFLYEKAEGSSL